MFLGARGYSLGFYLVTCMNVGGRWSRAGATNASVDTARKKMTPISPSHQELSTGLQGRVEPHGPLPLPRRNVGGLLLCSSQTYNPSFGIPCSAISLAGSEGHFCRTSGTQSSRDKIPRWANIVVSKVPSWDKDSFLILISSQTTHCRETQRSYLKN